MNNKAVIFLGVVISLIIPTYVFASSCHSAHERKNSVKRQKQERGVMAQSKENAPPIVEAGNKICPVTGAQVGTMGPVTQYNYKGKIYNFCCAGCIETFNDDPEKYVKIVAEKMGQDGSLIDESDDAEHRHSMGEERGV